MKKLKYNIAYILFGCFMLTSLASCDEGGEADAGGTKTKKFAGDWHISAYDTDGVTPITDYMLYSTYNASSNDENFWVDDHNNPNFQLKSKVQADFSNMTFSGPADADELYTGGTVTISNGKVLKNAGRSFGGHVVDSIYFEAEFDWDPGTIYKFGGHKRTGFLEDEL